MRPANRKGKGQHFVVTLTAATTTRDIPRGLAKHRSQLAACTLESDRLRERLARTKFSDVTRAQVQALMDAYRAEGHEPATLQNERAVIRGLFNHAANIWNWSEPTKNPAVDLELPPVNNERDRVMSADEQLRLDTAIQDCRNALIGPTLTLLTESAMRSSEPIVYARWCDVDWDEKLLKLTDSKNDKRDVPLSPKAIQALEELWRLNPGEPQDAIVRISYESLKAAWGRACDRAGVDGLRLQDLRHTAATRMALKTGNVFLVQRLTGHKTLSQVARYVNVKAADVVAVMHAPEPASVAPKAPLQFVERVGEPSPGAGEGQRRGDWVSGGVGAEVVDRMPRRERGVVERTFLKSRRTSASQTDPQIDAGLTMLAAKRTGQAGVVRPRRARSMCDVPQQVLRPSLHSGAPGLLRAKRTGHPCRDGGFCPVDELAHPHWRGERALLDHAFDGASGNVEASDEVGLLEENGCSGERHAVACRTEWVKLCVARSFIPAGRRAEVLVIGCQSMTSTPIRFAIAPGGLFRVSGVS